MNSSDAGIWQWNLSGWDMARTASCSKSPASTRRLFVEGEWSWQLLWWTVRLTGYACRVVGGRRRKKRPDHTRHSPGARRAETAGDPMTGQKWVRSSLRSVRDRLAAGGHPV